MQKYLRSDPPSRTAFPIAAAGYPFIFAAAFITAIMALLGLTLLTLIGLLVAVAICWFFRDPDRMIPDNAGAVVSPADGKVIAVDRLENSPFYDGNSRKISIFMSVFNVHVNRIPFDAQVKAIRYHPGKFFAANLDKASLQNEHNAVYLSTQSGKEICVVQIAGLVARRIICKLDSGDEVIRGQRFGLICFGSRLDVYLPTDIKIDVAIGDTVRAGTSILGYLVE